MICCIASYLFLYTRLPDYLEKLAWHEFIWNQIIRQLRLTWSKENFQSKEDQVSNINAFVFKEQNDVKKDWSILDVIPDSFHDRLHLYLRIDNT